LVWLLLLPDGEGPYVLLLKMAGYEAGVADVRVHPGRQDAHRVLTQPGHLEQGHSVHTQTREEAHTLSFVPTEYTQCINGHFIEYIPS
jgi:hypothetical protein